MKTHQIDTVRELLEWLRENNVSPDAKVEVWSPEDEERPTISMKGASLVVLGVRCPLAEEGREVLERDLGRAESKLEALEQLA